MIGNSLFIYLLQIVFGFQVGYAMINGIEILFNEHLVFHKN